MQIVSLERCDSYNEEAVYAAVEKLIDSLGGWKSFIRPGKKVALKPNLLTFKKPEEAATSHPSVVKAVISQIQKAGGIVSIVESPGGPYSTTILKHVYKTTGMEKIADQTGAILNYDLRVTKINTDQSKYIKQLEVLKPLTDADIVINLPKLKTHTMMTFTGAVKNMFGAIAGTAKADMHLRMADYMKFADCLIDIFLSVKPTLNIMDAIDGMEGYGPTNGSPRHIGVLLASTDGFSLDATALKMIGLPVKKVPVMFNASERKLLDEEIKIAGEPIENLIINDYNIPLLNEHERAEKYDRGMMKHLKKRLRPKPEIQNSLCVECGTCIENCPPGVIIIGKDGKPDIDYKNCIRCFCCQELCTHNAITIHRGMLSKMIMHKSMAGLK
ncbi:MAG: DUF362 domain-containing protein [Thermoclostridium sp.]|nr:DUF362 domain-containing protein [Thermoclostridium sp.]